MRIAPFAAAILAFLALLAAGFLGGIAAPAIAGQAIAGQAGFAALAVVLLLTPGPTNTLLALAGAARGWRPALGLLAAELAGYSAAIAVLVALLHLAGATRPELAWALRLAAAAYLTWLAWRLWRGADRASLAPGAGGAAVGFRRVFITTLLNPKALVFAFALPRAADAWPDWRNLLLLALLIPCAGACWIRLGAALRAGVLRGLSLARIHRGGALLLALFALLLILAGLPL